MRDDALQRWHDLLGEVGHHGEALCAAAVADDLIAAVAATMQLRRARAAVIRCEAPTRLRGTADELALLDQVSALTSAARAAEAAMETWRARPLPPDEALLASPLGAAVLADAILPAVWDFEADLVVLVGPGLEDVAALLRDLGQQRLVLLGGAPVPGALAVEDGAELTVAMRTMVPGAPTRVTIHGAPGTDREVLVALHAQVTSALADLRIHSNTVRAFSRTWIGQATTNLPALARWPSVTAVGDRFAGVPMVIIAPGPSLAANIGLLRDLRGRAIVTAFSHSLKPVLAAGIVPDLVLTVDPQDVRYHFAGCDLSRTCLVTAATAHPALFELPAPRHLTLSANSAIDDWIFEGVGEAPVIPGGGSVATSAFSLALRWRCDPIIFLGLDLSFPGGQYYVATSSDGAARAEVDAKGLMRVAGWSPDFHAMKAQGGPRAVAERTIELPGWHGGTVPSSFMFGMFHRWFVEQLAGGVPATVYNCTEGGSYIEGMSHTPLADVLATLGPTVDVAGALDAVVAAVDQPGRAARFRTHFAGYVSSLRRCRKLAQRGRALIAQRSAGPELALVERRLAEAVRPLGFVSMIAQREVELAADVARRAGTEQDYLQGSARLFEALIGVIDELKPQLDAAVGRLT